MNLRHNLSARSDFSIGESILQIPKLVDRAKELGYESLAICDIMSLHGMADFTSRCKKAGIKPVIGVRVRVFDDPLYRKPKKKSGEVERPNRSYNLKVYLRDESGLKSMIRLLSLGNSPEYFYYVSRVGLKEVLALEGVAVTTGDMWNLFHHEDHQSIARELQARFGEHFYVELPVINTPLFDTLNNRAMVCGAELGAKTLVSHPSCYLNEGDAEALEVMAGISKNEQLSEPWRAIQYVKDFTLDPPEAIAARARDAIRRGVMWYGVDATVGAQAFGYGMRNIAALAESCTFQFAKFPLSLPVMAENEFVTLGRMCLEGWKRRVIQPVSGYKPDESKLPEYRKRLEYELSTLKRLNFSGYFLLVEDLVRWAKTNGIVVGPGRGSVGGSLVAFLVGITDIDPLRFNLLFERFINPERIDLPDADLDFMSSRRQEVIEYLRGKYGADRVAGISNYTTLGTASALRDTGRIMGLSGLELSASKLVPKEHGHSASLSESVKVVPDIELFARKNPVVWAHALKLEGAVRSFATHAAGVVVAGVPLVERAVIESRGESPVCSWDKRIVEDFGLVKMDILGLSTLDVLEMAKRYVRERHGIDVDYLDLPLDEPDVMDAFGRGETTGVFQFTSPGMKKLLKDMAKSGRLNFEDIAAATALYRPGPMDLIPDYLAVKQGLVTPRYEHPSMAGVLEYTGGIMVYQEQVMQMSQLIAGYSGAEADKLRKIMGKKLPEEMEKERDKFVKGAVATVGFTNGQAGELFDKIATFASYGFNKSHAAEYSLLSYWTMWMRVRYPAEYFAANMSTADDDDLPGLVKDAREAGVEVLPPDINYSTDRFAVPRDRVILTPFSAVKGISQATAQRIVKIRETEGVWASKAAFATRAKLPHSKINVRVVDNLDKVGAFANIEPGSKPPRHPDRRRDQTELMPGLIIDPVKADRYADLTEGFLKAKLVSVVREYKSCKDCSLAGTPHPGVRCSSRVKYMVVSDCPNWQEKEKLLEGDAAAILKEAIKGAGLSVAEGYFTTLVKAKKNDKFLSNEQLLGCRKFIDREVELIKPPIIVALGSAVIRHFLPGVKGGVEEMAGKVVFDTKLNASIVCGVSGGHALMDPSKVDVLAETFQRVAEILE